MFLIIRNTIRGTREENEKIYIQRDQRAPSFSSAFEAPADKAPVGHPQFIEVKKLKPVLRKNAVADVSLGRES